MANLNVSETVEIDRSSLAGRIIAAGDSGLPRDTVEIYYQFDVRQRERREDPNISDRYRSELERQDREQT
jgi:hypothetical protein